MFLYKLLSDPISYFSVVVIVILSITIHECCHALAALSQGDDTAARQGRITLNPRAHMSQSAILMLLIVGVTWGSTPVNQSRLKWWFSPALVSFAGPMANLILMVISIWIALLLQHHAIPVPYQVTAMQAMAEDFFSLAAVMNSFLFLLNMLPVPPLDGFGILETFVPILRRYSFSLSQYGFFILIVLFFVLGLGSVLFRLAELMVWKVTIFSQGMMPAL